MIKKYLIFYLLLLLVKFTFSQKKNNQPIQEETPPEWVSKRPINNSKYIGIGVASKIGNANYQIEAKKNAFFDLTSEMKVNISSNSMLYSVQNNNQFNQNFNSLITLSNTDNIEGYKLIDTYENEKQYWVYYELDKEEYRQQKALKKQQTIEKSAQIILLAQEDEANKRYSAAIRKKVQAFSILTPYLNEEIDFSSYKLKNINNIFDLAKDIQLKLQAINIKQPTAIPIVKPYQLQYAAVQVKCEIEKSVLSTFPFALSSDEDVMKVQESGITGENGVLNISPQYVSANFQITTITFQPDIETLLQSDSISASNVKFLKSFIQLPKFTIQFNIQPLMLFIRSKEVNFNNPLNSNIVSNIIYDKLKGNEAVLADDPKNADYIIEINAKTVEDGSSAVLKNKFNQVLSEVIIDINLINSTKQTIYTSHIEDVFGYGTSLESAGLSAYKSDALINKLNEAAFFLKRKIIRY